VVALRARWLASALDAQLAAGVSPEESPELGLCAERLCSKRRRTAIAAGLERVARESVNRRPALSSAIPVRSEVAGPAREEMRRLAQELRVTRRPAPAAIALANRLLVDVHSPLYSSADSHALEHSIRVARAVLADADTS
jgi:hypothetical protein